VSVHQEAPANRRRSEAQELLVEEALLANGMPPSPRLRALRRRRIGRPAMPTISVLVPTLNEAKNLRHVLPQIPEMVDEIVLIDGGSTDGTIETARELIPEILVVREPRPGKGRALRTGFYASSGDIIVAIDADGSTNPREIPRFVDALLSEADFVKGSRFLHGGGTADMGLLRKAGNWFLMRAVRISFGGQYTDLCYGYNAFWRDVLPIIDDADVDGFEIETHMNVRVLTEPVIVREVPSFEHKRIHGTSNLRTFRDGFRVLRTILSERRRLSRLNRPHIESDGPNRSLGHDALGTTRPLKALSDSITAGS
jgi:glycosyltransferase involved in cell wall biosynthesis